MESLNNSPVLLLRQNNLSFKEKRHRFDKRMQNKRQLREEIYSNHNIFQSSVDLYRNMTAQNIIWDRNYRCKCAINQIKEENSSLKAKIWNVEKENRKMERQIEAWNLKDCSSASLNGKPYIDMATVQRVLSDQDYSIVSIKMQIFELQNQLQEKELIFEKLQQRNREIQKISSLLNNEITAAKVEVCQCIQAENNLTNQLRAHFREEMIVKRQRQNKQLDLLAKNIEIKKKSSSNVQNQLRAVSRECQLQKNVTQAEVERLNEETRKMKAEEDSALSLQRDKLGLAERMNEDYECYMQNQMGNFITCKLSLQCQIELLREQMNIYNKK